MAEISRNYVRRAIDEGTQPGVIADLVVDAITTDRFWVLPHPDFVDIAMRAVHEHRRGREPGGPRGDPGHAATFADHRRGDGRNGRRARAAVDR